MSDKKWTKEQLEAITKDRCNLLVAAAAGAGKTAVLVERIIRKITNVQKPIDIDKLLVVTFTNASATEMRERIGQALEKELEANRDSGVLQRQLTLLGKAHITTIHSFCLDVIKNNSHTIDLDPNFRIADDTESVLMKMEALEEAFETYYKPELADGNFYKLVECYGGKRDDRALQELVYGLYNFIQSYPWPDIWLKTSVEAFNINSDTDFSKLTWGKVLLETIRTELEGIIKEVEKAVSIIETAEGLEKYLPLFNDELSAIKELNKNLYTSWDNMYTLFSKMKFDRLPASGKDSDKLKQEKVKLIRDGVKKRLRKIQDDIFTSPSEEIIDDLKKLYPLMNMLSMLVKEYGDRYTAHKREKGLLDFNDLEHLCLKILTEIDDNEQQCDISPEYEAAGMPHICIKPSAAALSYRDYFEEILIDEYQDSNLVQEVILGMISRKDSEKPNMFMVGDVKQSIYRFRQARPELFLAKYNTYSGDCTGKNGKIKLFKNFRSRKEVIDCVNFIFKQVMSRYVGELEYDDEEALNPGAVYKKNDAEDIAVGGSVELHLIDFSTDKGDGYPEADADNSEQAAEDVQVDDDMREDAALRDNDDKEQLDIIQAEARLVVRKIEELTGNNSNAAAFNVLDKNTGDYRPVKYSDIVILLRSVRNWSDVFVEELEAAGIPVFADIATGYFTTVEIQTVISLLQVIDNPLQDIPLLAVLRSPIVSFNTDELVDIRLYDREKPFYDAMKGYASENDNQAAEKLCHFLESLDRWRDRALYMSTDELIWYLYSDTGFYSFVGALPGGPQRQANLRMLFDKAGRYEKTSYKGLFNFINFVNKLRSSGGDMGSARLLGENENVVRLMSIHKSKGLEFPVVIVAGCGKNFNMQDLNKSILTHQDMGLGPDIVDIDKHIMYPSAAKQAIKCAIRQETLSEEMRILYVAFTRAREKLIITGAAKNMGNKLKTWVEYISNNDIKIPEYYTLKAKNYLDWIVPAVMRHRDGELLINRAGIYEQKCKEALPDESRWQVYIHSRNEILASQVPEGIELNELSEELGAFDVNDRDEKELQYIDSILGWRYPFERAAGIPVKITVTELKRRFEAEISDEVIKEYAYVPALVSKPRFLSEKHGYSAAEKGTILHYVMQHLNFNRAMTLADIAYQVDAMVAEQLLSSSEAKIVDTMKILRFIKSPLGERLLAADNVYREAPFNIEICSSDIFKSDDSDEAAKLQDEKVMVQGVIDCYFEEDDGLVLIDYKTDYVPEDDGELLRKRFLHQIEYYSRALETLTGKIVKSKYVYLFWNGEIIKY